MGKLLRRGWVLALIGLGACHGNNGAGPASGAEGGHCYPNGTCNQGLVCLSNLCVSLGDGAAGSTSTGAAGTGGSGAAGSAAGDTGAAGAVTGGSGTNGSAGSEAGQMGTDGSVDRPMDGGSSLSDVAKRDATLSDAPLVRRGTCPPGPYSKPMAGTANAVCALTGRYPSAGGAVWIGGQGAFFFSTYLSFPGPEGDLVRYTPGVGCAVVIPDVGSRGLAQTADGRLIGASVKTSSISEFDLATGDVRILVDMGMGMPLTPPLDVAAHSNGALYVTTFTNPGGSFAGRVAPGVYWVGAGATAAVQVKTWPFMDGMGSIVLSPDESLMYAQGVGAWSLDGTGAPTAMQPAAAVGAVTRGGIAVDCGGNIYLSNLGGAAVILDPKGAVVAQLPQQLSGADLAFGGPDGKTLVGVRAGYVFAVPMNVPGPP